MKNLMILIIFSGLILSCSPKVIKETEYIETPVYIKPEKIEKPEKPKMEKVTWKKIGNLYCVDKENAKKLLKNLYKLDNYANELEIILQNIR